MIFWCYISTFSGYNIVILDVYDDDPLLHCPHGCVPFAVDCDGPLSAIFETSSLFSCLISPFAVPEASFSPEPLISVSSELFGTTG
jgi:hypothetical protein